MVYSKRKESFYGDRRLSQFKKIPIFILSLLFITTCLSRENDEKRFHLKKVESGVKIDGVIDSLWNTVDSVADFVQQSPYHGKNPSNKTVAKLCTTEEALYCLMVCYADKGEVQNHTGTLDNTAGDIVSVMFDTFGDKRTAYKFAVTASGVRADCRLLDDARTRDYNWDGVWFAETKVYPWGFVVEMEIPYRSIQYEENLTEWGLDFDRWTPAINEDIYWCAYEENEGQRISKFGKLVFEDFRPSVKSLNLEVYPVGITKATYLENGNYKFTPDAGIDIFYNPSPKLTYQLTANPDFAQIEADPFNFNITRYESYFNERRPFFTQGNEIFMASGKDNNTGFYQPLELFYSRRIGKKLPGGTDVPIIVGTKAFGRINDWDYGGFLALTDARDYTDDDIMHTEPRAYFGSARIKRQIFDNSTIGTLIVAKKTEKDIDAVIDIDGAFRQSDWQLSYQLARSFQNSRGDYAASLGFISFTKNLFLAARGRFIGGDFDVSQVGFVPWKGTDEVTAIVGPRWYYDDGYISSILLYLGGLLNYRLVEGYTNQLAVVGYNMQFRDNWGFEITFIGGRSKDNGVEYPYREFDLSSWYNISPKWSANLYGYVAKTYNYSREYLATFGSVGFYLSWHALDILEVGTSFDTYVEGNPQNKVEDITLNSRPYFSFTPVNNLNVRMYFDNVFTRSGDNLQRTILGFLFSYNFSPKSWIYLAVNEVRDRSDEFDSDSNLLPNRMHIVDRVAVLKVKYLYYF